MFAMDKLYSTELDIELSTFPNFLNLGKISWIISKRGTIYRGCGLIIIVKSIYDCSFFFDVFFKLFMFYF